MSMFITIFGGMLLTAVLYGLGRLLRLSNFWSAVIACAIPTTAYIVYAFMTGPGLDVITMHLVAYPTVSVMFGLLYGARAQHAVHWIPKLIVLFFVVLTLLLGGFVYIARQGLPPAVAQLLLPGIKGKAVHTGFSGVVSHQDEAAHGIAQQLEMQEKLVKLGWRIEITGLDRLKSGATGPVEVLVNDRESRPVENIAVNLELTRPGQHNAISLPMTGGIGSYHVTLPPLQAGHWIVRITLGDTPESTVRLEHDIDVL
jgi:nitrogen fixation protein FixH